MQIKINAPATLRQEIKLPASKSISNRALLIHALSKGQNTPQNISDCDDTFVMQRALTENPEVVDIMAAGTAMRFLSAYYAVTPGTKTITGTARMKQRPIGILVDALRTLGAQIEYCIDTTIRVAHDLGYEITMYEGTTTTFNNEFLSAEKMVDYYYKMWNQRFLTLKSSIENHQN